MSGYRPGFVNRCRRGRSEPAVGACGCIAILLGEPLGEVTGERKDAGALDDLRQWHVEAEVRIDAVAHLDRDQRVESEAEQRLVWIDARRRGADSARKVVAYVAFKQRRPRLGIGVEDVAQPRVSGPAHCLSVQLADQAGKAGGELCTGKLAQLVPV